MRPEITNVANPITDTQPARCVFVSVLTLPDLPVTGGWVGGVLRDSFLPGKKIKDVIDKDDDR